MCVCVVGVGVSAWFLYTTSYHRPCRTTTSSSTSSSETQVSYLVIKHVFFFSVFLFWWVNNNWVWYRCREIVSALAIHWQEIPTRAWSHHWCRVRSSHGHHRQSSYQASDLGHCKSHLSLFFSIFFLNPTTKMLNLASYTISFFFFNNFCFWMLKNPHVWISLVPLFGVVQGFFFQFICLWNWWRCSSFVWVERDL